MFFTIGHSTRTIPEFVDLLKSCNVDCLVDVRSYPSSRHCPQFNKATLPDTLSPFGIEYVHLEELGGRRGNTRQIAPTVNGLWTHPAFHNYADYASTSAEFGAGLTRLRDLGHARSIAYMCAEAVWWKCHRRIITDYLLAHDEIVHHILSPDKIERATPTKGSVCQHQTVCYQSEGLLV